jgi:outer membrane protein TolC
MMRWKIAVVGLALSFAGVVGCKQQCFLTDCDAAHYLSLAPMGKLDCDPTASITATGTIPPKPVTVHDPERPPRYMTLAEAIALSLENGHIGSLGLNGTANDNLVSFTQSAPQNGSLQGSVTGSDAIRAFSLDPSIVSTNIEASLAKFDAQWNTSLQWNATDQPPQGLNSFQTGTNATVTTSLLKPLPTGGVTGITFTVPYQDLSRPPGGFAVLNPAYSPTLQFQFEQPLLQGYGVEINQLRASHPGSVLTPFNTGGRVPGILITRTLFDSQRAEFEREVHDMVYNVEQAYWNLYGAYWVLYATEQALRQSYEAWRINKARFEAGRVGIQDLAQSRQQYESFRAQRLQALSIGGVAGSPTGNLVLGVLDAEKQLRGLLGLPVEDGFRLVPIDSPNLAPYEPDWDTAVKEALTLKPELLLARNDLKLRQLDLINVKNLLLPDLRFTSTYALNGIGGSLDGGDNNALRSLASDKFASWSLGLRLSVPIGFRDAHAQVRQAKLGLARSYIILREQEEKVERLLAQQYRHLSDFHELIQIQRSQREAAAEQLQARFREYLAGRGTLDILLESQRVWALALEQEYLAIVGYNNALAGFEWSRGTILQHDNIVIGEGALPACAAKRAVEHERERSLALVVHERANPVPFVGRDLDKGCVGVPALPKNEPVSLPSVLEAQPPLPDTNADNSSAPAANGTAPVSVTPAAAAVPAPEPASSQPKSMMDALRRWRSGTVSADNPSQ